ncbi:protein WHAT'S THIS FACTOR 9, mitochondrial [Euphorbia lathyris]|uniref:protein WHAT'S THIS FACTOR 9, mitochondrial n=1 Tax=Euphorbia lathyris TaxID=212925 RepID=UPI0033137482
MVLLSLLSREQGSNFLCGCRKGYNYQQKFSLVNVKLKWVKDRALDAVVAGQGELRATCNLISIISSAPHSCLPIYCLTPHRGQLGLPLDLKLSTFIRRYPTIFHESHILDSGGTRVPCFHLTTEVLNIHQEERCIIEQTQTDLVERVCKLLMLTRDRVLPLQTIDQLKWDFGLPYDYSELVAHNPDLFSSVCLPDGRTGLRLRVWNDCLAVSQLQKTSGLQQIDVKNNCLAFPIRFTRGFGLKRKCMRWLEEWQKLPYTSPYCNASHLDPRTDVSEKRIVGVFHELLHLTIQKKTERKNVSNLRTPLSLPQKFTKAFERHPGIFYISMKCDTQTVVLREAYDGQQLLQKHPLVEIREKYASLMERGFLDRSKGLYKENTAVSPEELSDGAHGNESNGCGSSPKEELDPEVQFQLHMNDQICDPC